jgi:hypothetical protein
VSRRTAWQNPPVSDWTTTAATAATAVGTLVLAVATFSSVRSAQRSARASEAALLAGIRPVLVSSRLEDAPQKVGFIDEHWAHVAGGHASVEVTDDGIYLLVSLRNVGNGLAVLDRWDLMPDRVREELSKGEEESFRRLTRDIYIAAGDVGFWQGALRDPDEEIFKSIHEAAEESRPLTLDILYRDHEGGQRTITRFGLIPAPDGQWLAVVSRHWNLDRPEVR